MEHRVETARAFPWRIFFRTISVQLALLVGAIALSGFLARSFFMERNLEQIEDQMQASLEIASHALPSMKVEEWCAFSSRGTRYRVTLIQSDGLVVCDSHHSTVGMENHLDRSEVSDAIGTGRGVATRHSHTVDADMLYLAQLDVSQQRVMRFAIPLSDLAKTIADFDRALLIALLLIALVLALGEVWVAHVFVRPLRAILLRAQVALGTQESGLTAADLGRATWGEWEHLDGVIESLRREIKEKMDALRQERNDQAIIMDSISDAIVVVDWRSQIVFANRRFEALFPRLSKTESRTLIEICRDPLALDTFASAARDLARSQVQPIRLETRQGTRFFSLAVAPLERGSGENAGVVGVFHDITDLKLAEQMRIDFVANVSHEMRTPLASIKGYASTALADIRSGLPISEAIVEPIVRNSERMVRIVSDLLDISQLDSGTPLNIEQIPCEEITSRVVSSFRREIESRSMRVIVGASDAVVSADPVRVEQVLTNLIDNACKYSPDGGEVAVSWIGDDTGMTLEVRDTGPGIEPQHLGRLFERFYRVDKGRSRNLGGTGLGLAIVKHIMLAHGGTASVESVVGKGTVFRCRFPRM